MRRQGAKNQIFTKNQEILAFPWVFPTRSFKKVHFVVSIRRSKIAKKVRSERNILWDASAKKQRKNS
eukprot:TRINITY_DN1415_c0_g1_i1.p1 TRINITY_DN1415_c0_g1~~TRINITY_DN1415_c0_g1_i1.p1  ORF type:complete len:67 (+),score=7.65 TRINITY_DN1415_c0_g1_i1:68-268(+)